MTKRKGRTDEPRTANEFIGLAAKRGADIRAKGMKTRVSTSRGSVNIIPGDRDLNAQAVSRLKRFFKLLGLMILVGLFIYVRFILHLI